MNIGEFKLDLIVHKTAQQIEIIANRPINNFSSDRGAFYFCPMKIFFSFFVLLLLDLYNKKTLFFYFCVRESLIFNNFWISNNSAAIQRRVYSIYTVYTLDVDISL